MKKVLILAAAAGCLLGGCNRTPARNRPVKETYIHKYGLCVSKDEWESHGRSGTIVNARKDGVKVSASYHRGELHGETTYTFSNSDIIARTEQYDSGKLIAETANYPTGTPKTSTKYGPQDACDILSWYEDGTPRCREHYQGDRLASAEYFNPQNILESRIDQGQGLRIARNAYGQLQCEDQISDGQMVLRRTFHPNGDPKEELAYCNGQIHGTRRTFLVGGVPNTVEEWRNGHRDGLVVTFHNGQKHSEAHYRHDERHGLERRFGPDGKVAEQLNWVRGREHGAHRYLLEGDEKIDWYHKGQIVNKTTFDKLNLS